jgi:Glyoxalase-like domain
MASVQTLPRLDHVVVNVRRGLADAARRYLDLGFTLTEPSHHTLGSMNRLALFDDHYIELLGVDPEAPHPREELMRAHAGLSAIVFATDDATGLHAALQAKGVPIEAPRDFSRPVIGAGEARFRTVHVTAEAVPFGRLYFCQHFTREIVWGAAAHSHSNGAVAVARITIETRDPGAAAGLFRRLFGAEAVRAERTGFVVALEPAAHIEIQRGNQDRIAALTLRTRSLAAARRALGAQARSSDDAIAVSPENAAGAALEFVE